MSIAEWSNQLFAVTLVAYTAGMLAFAVDLAFGRRAGAGQLPPAQRRPAEPARAREVELVIAGRGTPLPEIASGDVSAPMVEPYDEEVRPRGLRPTARVAIAVTAAGWLLHLAEVVTRGVAAGRVPWGNMYEFSSAVSLIAVAVFLILAMRTGAADIGVYVLVPVVSYLGLAGTVLYTSAAPLQPVLNSYWLKIHVVAALTATGTFMVGGVVTLLLLVRRGHDRRRAASEVVMSPGALDRLPAARTLDLLERRIITLAFPVWTFAIVAGAIWAESAWGRYWGWDPKETWAFITWVLYAAYLHCRATARWRRAAPVFALLAFTALVFNYYVVNLVVNGLHSYAGV